MKYGTHSLPFTYAGNEAHYIQVDFADPNDFPDSFGGQLTVRFRSITEHWVGQELYPVFEPIWKLI
jgi:hypothetical protein